MSASNKCYPLTYKIAISQKNFVLMINVFFPIWYLMHTIDNGHQRCYKTRPVQTSFKIAVRTGLLTHYYGCKKERKIDK